MDEVTLMSRLMLSAVGPWAPLWLCFPVSVHRVMLVYLPTSGGRRASSRAGPLDTRHVRLMMLLCIYQTSGKVKKQEPGIKP